MEAKEGIIVAMLTKMYKEPWLSITKIREAAKIYNIYEEHEALIEEMSLLHMVEWKDMPLSTRKWAKDSIKNMFKIEQPTVLEAPPLRYTNNTMQ